MKEQLINYTGTYTDQYELAMAEVYFKSGRSQESAVFDYSFRSLPKSSGYVLFAGLYDFLDVLQGLRFSDDDLRFLAEQNHDKEFLTFLKNFKFNGSIYACEEGELIFPGEPVLRVEGTLLEAQIIETLLLNIINFESLVATKASRIRRAAGSKTLLEFGLRRAQGPGGYLATRAAMVGGFDGTSFVRACMDLKLQPVGTMAHSYVQSEADELTAFRKFCQERPHNCVLLLDTYSTLKSGLPNAITVAKEMEKRGQKLKAIRLDSGDLTYLSKECRKALDSSGLSYVKIVASNQLDEFIIESLVKEEAPIDVFGIGTRLVTGYPEAALDGVYKLAEVNGEPKIKLSESISKITLPHRKDIFRLYDSEDRFLGVDAVGLVDETEIKFIHHPVDPLSSLNIQGFKVEPLLKLRMKEGQVVSRDLTLPEIRNYAMKRLSLLPSEYQRFTNPHLYKVGLTDKLIEARDKFVRAFKERYV